MGKCLVCDETIPDPELINHLRALHPHEWGDGPERWPDGGLVIHEPDADIHAVLDGDGHG